MGDFNTILRDLLAIFFRRLKLILLVFVSGVATAAVLAVTTRPTYVATAKLMLSPERADVIVSPDSDARPVVQAGGQELSSEVVLLRSADLVREVLEPYRREKPKDAEPGPLSRLIAWSNGVLRLPMQLYRNMHDVHQADSFQMWVLGSTERLTVLPIGRSDLLSVSYEDPDPRWAATFVNAVVSHHVVRRARLNQQLGARRFYESQRQLLNERVRDAGTALREFTEREGSEALPEQRAALRTRLTALETALGGADTELAEARARVAYLSRLGAQARESLKSDDSTAGLVQADPKQIVQTRILELELQRNELLVQYAPTSIKVRDVDQQLEAVRRLLGAEGDSGAGVPGSSSQTVQADLEQTRAEVTAVTARRETLEAQIAAQRERAQHFDRIAPDYDRLVQEVETAKQSFLTYVNKEEEARFADALDESKIVNVIIAEDAQVPAVPQPSKAPLVVALAAIGSLIAGLVLALIRDRLDPSVKSASEAQLLTELPVLADIRV